MSLQDELRRLHSAKKPYANGRAVGQQAGNESYMLIATGTTFGLLIEAADELDRLQAELAAAKRDDADMRRWWRWWRQAINEAIAKQEPKNVD